MRKSLLISAIAVLCVFAGVMTVYAKTYAYGVTSNYHGKETPLGATVIVTATTDDPTVFAVTFLWKNAAEEIKFTDVIPVSGGTAQSSHQPNSLGDWGVQALFQGPSGKTKQDVNLVVAIRATSFNVVPEIPLIGTAGASIAMFAGLAVKMKRKPQH
jgi:hypothetical protein